MRRAFLVVMMLAVPATVYSQDEMLHVRDQYLAAAATGDAAKLAGLFADDALLLGPDGVVKHGPIEIAKYFADVFGRSGSADFAFSRTTAESKAGFGSETGRYEERATGIEGTYVAVYRQDDAGQWRIAIEILATGGPARSAQQ